jgi:hypothetical protein
MVKIAYHSMGRFATVKDRQMSRGKHRFQEGELTRAIKAAAKGGQPASEIHIDKDGGVTLKLVERQDFEEVEHPTAA